MYRGYRVVLKKCNGTSSKYMFILIFKAFKSSQLNLLDGKVQFIILNVHMKACKS